ncbi:MAG: hypothetical protein QXM96_03085 [Candidatus Woesearchaeota archaeon]
MEFLKKIFKIEPKEINLNLIDVQDYLDENSNKILEEEIDVINKDINDFKNLLYKLKEKIKDFENKNLNEISVNEREKLFFDSFKKSYLIKTYSFIENIENQIQNLNIETSNLEKLEKFCSLFFEELKKRKQENIKNNSVLSKHFQLDEIEELLESLNNKIKDINEFLNDGKLSEYKRLKVFIKQLNEKKYLSEKLNKELTELEDVLKLNKEKKELSEKKLEEIKNSQDFLTYKKIVNEKESILLEIKKIESDLNKNFKILEASLKKQAHASLKNEIIFDYLSSPLIALEKDNELKIAHILEQIKLNLNYEIEKYEIENKDNEIENKNSENIHEIKELKKELKILENLNKDYFEKIKKDILKLKSDLEIIQGVLDRTTIIMEIKDLEYQIEHFSKKCFEIEEEIKNKKEKLKEMEKIKKEKIEKMLYDFTDKKIIITDIDL